jgi:hypothetical protein
VHGNRGGGGVQCAVRWRWSRCRRRRICRDPGGRGLAGRARRPPSARDDRGRALYRTSDQRECDDGGRGGGCRLRRRMAGPALCGKVRPRGSPRGAAPRCRARVRARGAGDAAGARARRAGGEEHSRWALDYFVFSRSLWGPPDALPAFAIGRPAFDNWLVRRAVLLGKPVPPPPPLFVSPTRPRTVQTSPLPGHRCLASAGRDAPGLRPNPEPRNVAPRDDAREGPPRVPQLPCRAWRGARGALVAEGPRGGRRTSTGTCRRARAPRRT